MNFFFCGWDVEVVGGCGFGQKIELVMRVDRDGDGDGDGERESCVCLSDRPRDRPWLRQDLEVTVVVKCVVINEVIVLGI